MHRRSLLSSLAIAGSGLAGCIGATPTAESSNSTNAATDDGSGHVRPDGDPPTVPAPRRCEDEAFVRHPPAYERVRWGTASSLSLRVGETSFEYGDTAHIEARNITADAVDTGTQDKFQFEVLTTAGWQDTRGHADSEFDHTEMGLGVPPGETITWALHLTEAGVLPEPNYEDLRVCSELVTGRYRFVFFGVEPAVAVAFDLTRSRG